MHLTSICTGRSNPRDSPRKGGRGEACKPLATAISLLLQEHADTPGTTTTGRRPPLTWPRRTRRGGHSPSADVWAPATGAMGDADIEGSSPRALRRHIRSLEFAGPLLLPLPALGCPLPSHPLHSCQGTHSTVCQKALKILGCKLSLAVPVRMSLDRQHGGQMNAAGIGVKCSSSMEASVKPNSFGFRCKCRDCHMV
ncbi:hypothetical protein BHM03_00038361 [Ensete ventricosum]|nr:hypothetical protein BHM03_00038361 [Ensete ventricosum]